jgi:hypothetical protein
LRLGFYRSKRIEPEIPQILGHYPAVPWTQEEVAARERSGDPDDARLAALIREDLASGLRVCTSDTCPMIDSASSTRSTSYSAASRIPSRTFSLRAVGGASAGAALRLKRPRISSSC